MKELSPEQTEKQVRDTLNRLRSFSIFKLEDSLKIPKRTTYQWLTGKRVMDSNRVKAIHKALQQLGYIK